MAEEKKQIELEFEEEQPQEVEIPEEKQEDAPIVAESDDSDDNFENLALFEPYYLKDFQTQNPKKK